MSKKSVLLFFFFVIVVEIISSVILKISSFLLIFFFFLMEVDLGLKRRLRLEIKMEMAELEPTRYFEMEQTGKSWCQLDLYRV